MIYHLLEYIKCKFNKRDYEVLDDLWLYYVSKTLSVFVPSMPIVIIDIHDHLIYSNLCKPSEDNPIGVTPMLVSESVSAIKQLVSNNQSTQFIVFQENKFIERELSPMKNLHIITNHGGLWIEYENRKSLLPVLDKELSAKHVLCLNNNPRPHRVGTVMHLLSRGLGENTIMSFMSRERSEKKTEYDYSTILSWAEWDDSSRDLFTRLNETNFGGYEFLAEYVYGENSENVGNFKNKLKIHYQNTFIDIITETTCIEPSCNIAEKYINSIFGCSFPILISSHGAVGFIRSLGFDVFDDVIDHSYDNEPNPFYRMKKAIDLNYEILSDSKMAKSLWDDRRDRFQKNVTHHNGELYRNEFRRMIGEIDLISEYIKDCAIT